jgi:hypothetical protein
MSNTWEYRYAFRVQAFEDVPPEFRNAYTNLAAREGDPVLSFFSPALQEGHVLMSRWTPPRLWVVFPNSLALLSLDQKSDAVTSFVLRREDFLGFGYREFLLNCCFSVYPGRSEGEPIEVRFPSRAEEKYQDLAKFFVGWARADRPIPAQPECAKKQNVLAGLPPKFAHLMEWHPEFGKVGEMFFQPHMVFGRRRSGEWPNLSLLLTSEAVVVLADQYRGRWSEYGVEYLYLPLTRVKLAEWVEAEGTDRGGIRVHLEGASRHTSVCWDVFMGLKPYALRWVWVVECTLQTDGRDIGQSKDRGTQMGNAGALKQIPGTSSTVSCEPESFVSSPLRTDGRSRPSTVR